MSLRNHTIRCIITQKSTDLMLIFVWWWWWWVFSLSSLPLSLSLSTGFLTANHWHINWIDLGAKEGCSVPDLCQRHNLPLLLWTHTSCYVSASEATKPVEEKPHSIVNIFLSLDVFCSVCSKGVFLSVVAFILLIFDRKLSNGGEAQLVSQLTLGLLEILGNKKYSIAIITPYNTQRTVITSLLHAR